jgi:hypothetical protein
MTLAVKDSKNISHTKEMIIRDFVMNSLLNQYAKESQLDISEAELDEEVQRVRSTHPDDITFKDALLKEGITFNDWRLKTKVRLLQQKAMRKMVEASAGRGEQYVQPEQRMYHGLASDLRTPNLHAR